MELHAFRGECDTIIATDEEDAYAVALAHSGIEREEVGELTRLDPAATLKIGDDEGGFETKTVAEWIGAHGRGFLCSTEW